MRRSCEQAAPEPAAREQGWRAWANGSALSDGPTKDAIAPGGIGIQRRRAREFRFVGRASEIGGARLGGKT
jgi:hypothetical protein